MECPCCGRSYSNSQPDTFPRVLLLCGHTFCHRCVASQLKSNSILCFTCGKVSNGNTVDTFPINETLLNIVSGKKTGNDPVCKQHGRKLEIYCETDQKLLCSECIINSHKHHKMCTITAQVERNRAVLDECLKRVQEGQESYRNEQAQTDRDQIRIQQEFLNCESEANLFYKTVKQEIQRLREFEIERLENRRDEALKQLGQQRKDLQLQINFMEKIIGLYKDLSSMSQSEFLLKDNMRDFIKDNSHPKKIKYTTFSLQFKKGPCLQEIARSVQQMIQLQKNRNAVTSSALTFSPSLKKSKQPAVLQVNLCEEYQKRKGTGSFQKGKPPKKTISIHQEKSKVVESVGSARNNSFNGKEGRPCSARRSRENRQLQELLQEDELNLSENFTPLASIHSFMRSSRNSEVNSSLVDDTTLRNTFADFSVLEGQEIIYHLGGLSSCETQRYYPQNGHSERLSTSNAQFKGQRAHCVYLRAYHPDRCLIMGGFTNSKEPTSDIFEFSFRDHRISKSSLKLQHPRTGVACLSRGTEVFVVGGRRNKPLNLFDRYQFDGKAFLFSAMPSMIHPREQLGCCLGFDGRLYAIGGVGLGNEAISSAQTYIWERDQWESIQSMRQSRMNFAVVSTPRGIYAIGGHTNKQYLAEVQFFDLEQRRWIQCSPLRHPRSYHTAVLSRDYQTITVFGGLHQKKQLDSIQVYDIQRNEWTNGGIMKAKRCLHVSVTCPK